MPATNAAVRRPHQRHAIRSSDSASRSRPALGGRARRRSAKHRLGRQSRAPSRQCRSRPSGRCRPFRCCGCCGCLVSFNDCSNAGRLRGPLGASRRRTECPAAISRGGLRPSPCDARRLSSDVACRPRRSAPHDREGRRLAWDSARFPRTPHGKGAARQRIGEAGRSCSPRRTRRNRSAHCAAHRTRLRCIGRSRTVALRRIGRSRTVALRRSGFGQSHCRAGTRREPCEPRSRLGEPCCPCRHAGAARNRARRSPAALCASVVRTKRAISRNAKRGCPVPRSARRIRRRRDETPPARREQRRHPQTDPCTEP